MEAFSIILYSESDPRLYHFMQYRYFNYMIVVHHIFLLYSIHTSQPIDSKKNRIKNILLEFIVGFSYRFTQKYSYCLRLYWKVMLIYMEKLRTWSHWICEIWKGFFIFYANNIRRLQLNETLKKSKTNRATQILQLNLKGRFVCVFCLR